MKKFLQVILCLMFFSSCTTYHVITEEDFGNAGAAALNYAVERYTLDSIKSLYTQEDLYYKNSPLYYEDIYMFNGGYEYTVKYRYGVTDNDFGHIYIKECNLEYCTLDSLTCSEIDSIYSNLPKSEVRYLSEGVYLGGMIGIAVIPFLSLLVYCAFWNVK